MARFYSGSEVDGAKVTEAIRKRSLPLDVPGHLDPIMSRIGDAKIVMLGEATHGTHEYYTWRSIISQRLIKEKGFSFIAVEGDWPDCYQVNQFVKSGETNSSGAADVLSTFDRWPTWMWANWEIVALAEWLKKDNSSRDVEHKTGFYGLDVYSLWESMEAVIEYLEKHDQQSLQTAYDAYRCFEPHMKDEGRSYANALRFVPDSCEDEVVELLKQLQERLIDHKVSGERIFNVEQNALVTVNAERYYRSMLGGGAASWNVRDTHMFETLERLLDLHGPDSRGIVWEHNTHIGDARATDMADDGMINIGQLAREKYGEQVVLVGFGSFKGTVMAGNSWGAQMRVMEMPEARKESWEYYCHKASAENKLMIMDNFTDSMFMDNHIDHRAVGVVYNPHYERYGNYVPTILPNRYDAFLHIDQSKALHPLGTHADKQQMPETYPFGV